MSKHKLVSAGYRPGFNLDSAYGNAMLHYYDGS